MEALIAALADPDSMVRASAASALRYSHELGAKPHPDAVPRLIELLSRETDGFVREAAQRSLAAFGVTTP
jgi:HEAT repeat protein